MATVERGARAVASHLHCDALVYARMGGSIRVRPQLISAVGAFTAAIAGAGLVLVLPGGFSPFLNYRALLGYKDQSGHAVTVGLRFPF